MNEKDINLFNAIKLNKDPEEVKRLIKAGANVNAAKEDGWTPLMEAASLDDEKIADEITKILLAADANPNAKKKYGWTALMEAAYCGNLSAVGSLIDADAHTMMALDGKWTALSAAYEGWSSATPERANVYRNVAEKLRQSGAE